MGIKVIYDRSQEGLEIKRALETGKLQDMLTHSFVIRWGAGDDDECDGVVFNSMQSVMNTLNKENMIMIMRKNRVKCPRRIKPGRHTEFPIIGRKYEHQGGNDIRLIDNLNECSECDSDYFIQYLNITDEYVVHVIDLNVFYIEEKFCEKKPEIGELVVRSSAFGWKLRPVDLSVMKETDKNEIGELAVRAVHSLGLDFGVVNMGRTSEGRYYVLDVDATCRTMSNECMQAYIVMFTKTLLKYEDIIEKNKDITVGADVECVMKDTDTGALIFASEFFPMDGPAGHDNRSIEAGRKYFPLLEIRPDYSADPLKVVDSIKSIINEIGNRVCYKNVGLYAGSMPVYNYWSGGHIHFGTIPNSKLLRALDNYLALPVMMIENASSARGRNEKYGLLGNFRLKSHGGFEYRTLSSWIISPDIAGGVLCLAKVIVQEYLNLNDVFLEDYYDIRAYYSVNKSCFKNKVKTIISNITDTETFKRYRLYIEPLFGKIISCEEWDENKPINQAWNMNSYENVYKPMCRCFIPSEKREELGIELEDIVDIMIGRQKFRLMVYPKDDFSVEKCSNISFSGDICASIGVDETENVGLWYDSRLKEFKAGPVLGILCDVESDEHRPFGKQTYYFRKLIKFSKSKGMIVYVFSLNDIKWKYRRVNGYTYDFINDKWVMRRFPIPDVIYDRGDVVCRENYGEDAVKYINNVRKLGIKFINSPGCISITNDKWITYRIINSRTETRKYQPKTFLFRRNAQIFECLERYGHIFIKLRNGSRGKGIFSVKKIGKSFEIIHKNRLGCDLVYTVGKNDLLKIINNSINDLKCKKTDFIVQKGVTFSKYKGRSFEIRVIMQKNSGGKWFRTCMVARCWGEEGRFINPDSETDERSTVVLKESLGSDAEWVADRIREVSRNVVAIMDDMGIQAGEIAIDFAVDNKLNIFIIELNSKPDNLLLSIGAFKMRNLAANRILEYGRFLATR